MTLSQGGSAIKRGHRKQALMSEFCTENDSMKSVATKKSSSHRFFYWPYGINQLRKSTFGGMFKYHHKQTYWELLVYFIGIFPVNEISLKFPRLQYKAIP